MNVPTFKWIFNLLIQYLVESISHTLFAICLIGDFTDYAKS